MIKPSIFFETLKSHNINFFTGVPDSLLKDFCAYVTKNVEASKHIIAANEGTAIGLAAGYHLATGLIPLVYMQNSGIGNATNPLLSLAAPEVYNIPMLLVIGWRGEPGVKDEPQHVCQGRVTTALLDAMEIPHIVLSDNEKIMWHQVYETMHQINETGKPHALLVRKGTFDEYKLPPSENAFEMNREDAIKIIVDHLAEDDIVVSTTGMTSRELFEYRKALGHNNDKDFLTVGSMGHASSISLGIALNTERRVVCLDGDGAVLMHFGNFPIIGSIRPKNLCHVILNNGAHDSVGGQPTIGHQIDFAKIANLCGYKKTISVSTKEDLINAVNLGFNLIEVKLNKGHRKDLSRPNKSPIENKIAFMKSLKK